MRRIAETTRSSCFLSLTSRVMSITAPSVDLLILAARFQAADVGLLVEQRRRNLVQHARAILGVDHHLHRERLRFAARPFDVDLALHFVHQVLHIGAVDRMHRDALAARHVADDRFAADRIAALGAIHQQIVDALDLDDQVLDRPARRLRRADAGRAGRRRGRSFRAAPDPAPASAAPGAPNIFRSPSAACRSSIFE